MPRLIPAVHEECDIEVSVIVPAHNAGTHLENCLSCLQASVGCRYEILVVDDASTDHTRKIALQMGAYVVQLQTKSGPAAARNSAVGQCRGKDLAFIDSDVLVTEDVLQQLRDALKDASVAAVFGSYDTCPKARNFVSVFKNLMHHFFHQRSAGNARTFWSGCGAIKKNIFEDIGGFDERFSLPGVEDIELGMRLTERGHSIILDPSIQAKHTKKWTLKSLMYTDIFRRGIPWTRLMLNRDGLYDRLNTSRGHRASVLLAGIMALMTCIISVLNPLFAFAPIFVFLLLLVSDYLSAKDGIRKPVLTISAVILVSGSLLYLIYEPLTLSLAFFALMILIINVSSCVFLLRTEGVAFVVMSLPLHLLYYFYCGLAFAAGALCHWLKLPLFPNQKGTKGSINM